VLFADPASNGKRLCDAVGPEGSSYLALGGNETINPLDVVSTDLAEQVAAVARKLMIVLGKTSGERGNLQVHPREFSELEEAALDLALQKLYGPAGEHLKPMSTGKRLPPLLSDLATTLREVIATEGLSEAQPLARHLTYFLRTTKGRIFNQQTSIAWQFNAAVIAYSFEQVPDNRLPIYYLLLFEALDRYVRTRPRTAKRFIACIDEFKLMAQVPALRRYVEGFTRWWRQRRGAMWTADQTLSTYLDDPSTLANVAVKFFFKMDEADLQFLERVYGAVIAPEEIDLIRHAREGQCLALFGTHPEQIYVPLTGIEHAAFLGPLEEVAHAALADPDERGDSTLTAALDARADRAVASVEGHLSESQEGRD
jgi:hypothetical protein